MTVDRDHAYRISSFAALVHNTCFDATVINRVGVIPHGPIPFDEAIDEARQGLDIVVDSRREGERLAIEVGNGAPGTMQ